MNISLINVDSKTPNLALMKISAWHKSQGDNVKWHGPKDKPDIAYASKIFNYTSDFEEWPDCEIIRGGTGYDLKSELPSHMEYLRPDYSLYGIDYGLGFTTRGCLRNCPWCVVPEKEGDIRAHQDFEGFVNPLSKNLVLLDNNVLASEFGIANIGRMADEGYAIDFNQGLDARLIDAPIAKLLTRCRWLKYIRLACDVPSHMPIVEKAIRLIRSFKAKQGIFVYVLVKDIPSAYERVEFLRSLKVDPFAQPFRDIKNPTEPPKELRHFARWVNHKAIFKTVSWQEYMKGKNICA